MSVKDQIDSLKRFAEALDWGYKSGLIKNIQLELPASNGAASSAATPAVPRTSGKSIIKEIFDAVAKLPDTFSTRAVLDAMSGRAQRPSVNDALRRLIKANVLEVVEQGSGRKATTYRKVK